MPGHVPREVRTWLRDRGSLTKRLQRTCPPGGFATQVLFQGQGRPRSEEARLLGLRPGLRALVREVHLLCLDRICVYARSVIPYATLCGPRRRLACLGTKPLGAALFADPSLRRLAVEILALRPDTHGTRYQFRTSDPVWGRRSLFLIGNRPLLVAEYFYPEFVLSSGGV